MAGRPIGSTTPPFAWIAIGRWCRPLGSYRLPGQADFATALTYGQTLPPAQMEQGAKSEERGGRSLVRQVSLE